MLNHFLAQSYFKVDKFYRENIYYLALLPPLSPQDRLAVMSRYGDGLETDVLQGIFNYGTSVTKEPLMIDTREPLVTRFRRGFENSNIPVPPPISPGPTVPSAFCWT